MQERLRLIIEHYGLTPTSFAQMCGIAEGTIRKILTDGTTIRSDNLLKISQRFQNINIDWLITGRGGMLIKGESALTGLPDRNDSQMRNRLKEFIGSQGLSIRTFEEKIRCTNGRIQKFIKNDNMFSADVLIKIASNFPQLNIYWLLLGEGEMYRKMSMENMVPVDIYDKLFEVNQQLNQQIGELRNEITHLEQENSELKKRLVPSQPTAAAQ